MKKDVGHPYGTVDVPPGRLLYEQSSLKWNKADFLDLPDEAEVLTEPVLTLSGWRRLVAIPFGTELERGDMRQWPMSYRDEEELAGMLGYPAASDMDGEAVNGWEVHRSTTGWALVDRQEQEVFFYQTRTEALLMAGKEDLRIVVLSSPILLEKGEYIMQEIPIEKARRLARWAKNYSQHPTVRLLGLEPSKERADCPGYDAAIVVKLNSRFVFGREYTLDEIKEIGYQVYIIEKIW